MALFARSLAQIDAIIDAAASGTTSTLDLTAIAAPTNGQGPRVANGMPAQAASSAPKPQVAPAAPAGQVSSEAPAQPKKEKQPKGAAANKGEAKKPAAPKPAKAPPAPDRPIDVSWLDLRVGTIVSAERHPESDKLYVERIDVGEDEPRTILSGLAQHMPLDAVQGARVVVICNLPPRPLAGILSHGMVLCASELTPDGVKGKTEFVVPPAEAAVGERIAFSDYPGEPEEDKKIKKKKVWETCAPELKTDGDGVATYKGCPWTTMAGPCRAATIKNSPIS